MQWVPNVDAGWEWGRYEIYARRDGGYILLKDGKDFGIFWTLGSAAHAAKFDANPNPTEYDDGGGAVMVNAYEQS